MKQFDINCSYLIKSIEYPHFPFSLGCLIRQGSKSGHKLCRDGNVLSDVVSKNMVSLHHKLKLIMRLKSRGEWLRRRPIGRHVAPCANFWLNCIPACWIHREVTSRAVLITISSFEGHPLHKTAVTCSYHEIQNGTSRRGLFCLCQ